MDDKTPHIAGDTSRLSEEQRGWIARAAELGRTRLGPRAAEHDAQGCFPREDFNDLHAAGLLALAADPVHGGAGADLLGCALVVAELGRWSGSSSLCLALHLGVTLWGGAVAVPLPMDESTRAAHEAARAVREQGLALQGEIWAQAFSEGGAADAGRAAWATVAHRVEGGYLVNGKKLFVSMAGEADFHAVLCTLDRTAATQRDALLLAVPKGAPGLHVRGDWNPLGMRATASRSLELHDVFVPDAQRLLPEGLFAQAAARFPHGFALTAAPYLGIAQAAYDFTVQYLRGEAPGVPSVPRRMYPTKQMAVAQMRLKLEQARALFLQAFGEARLDPEPDARMRLLAMQHTVVEQAAEIGQLALRTCGGQALSRSLPLERLLRDARCGAVMLPWTAELCLDALGRESLYSAGEHDEQIDA